MWYTGTISQAVAYAKMKRYIFMIYMHGSNQASKEMEKTWEEEDVQMLSKEHFVSCRFDVNSKEGKQFSQICILFFLVFKIKTIILHCLHISDPVLHVPSTYFVGQNGMPIEILAGNIQPSQFLVRANEAIQVHQQHLASIEAAGGSVNQPAGYNQTKYEEPPPAAQAGFFGLGRKPASKPEQPVDQKIKREREAAEEKRRMLMERQKAEEEAANMPMVDTGGFTTEDHTNETCKIQFRFPDGSSMNREFHSHELLEDVVAHVAQYVGPDFGPFTLATLHPRKQLTDDYYLESLESLHLVPSAVLMVLPGSSEEYEQASWKDDLRDFLWWLLTPFIVLYRLILSLIQNSNKKSKQPRRTLPAAHDAGPISNQPGNVRYRGGGMLKGLIKITPIVTNTIRIFTNSDYDHDTLIEGTED
ncbi:uncharacterized protein TRIADDRAFT_53813 [Trichoplax adhaerens]|uniref:UBX domain-containing protein 4 n=1 Tax=Trichoplax adhaerens TaxID=10228 RepID=B3RQ85_TRIAD|nr:hypothetical protein TRIADDRAFT_53813 [Trichoplax adhaerens]EDV28308.1 hypothetical protein TRIADDRAFT_53813 [Trichoplax adhaerens]|eukprot:XP_002110142.1 hypothetical protein TRIADDRAFT_53813 [Trichoplax adhaerens]